MNQEQVIGVYLNSNQWIIANNRQAWLSQADCIPDSIGDKPLSNGIDSLDSIQNLLDGSIAAACSTVSSREALPPLTQLRWLWRLSGLYHLTHSTPTLMHEAAEGFSSKGQVLLAQWAEQKAIEEQGHDLLALSDIRSLGYEPEWVVQILQPPTAIALVNYFTRCVRELETVSCVGYAYGMERLAMNVSSAYIQTVGKLLPDGVMATRCLRVHSGIGSDQDHVQETVACVAQLSYEELAQIALACYQTSLISFTPPADGYISDADIQRQLNMGSSKLPQT